MVGGVRMFTVRLAWGVSLVLVVVPGGCTPSQIVDRTQDSATAAVLGAPCADASECSTDFCVDGVCCQEACDGVCRSCNSPGQEGRCVLAPIDTDPRAQCPEDMGNACGSTGACDGAGHCSAAPVSMVCQAPRCVGSVRSLAGTCDGAGQCSLGGEVLSCAPYRCGNDSQCLTVCATSADCADGKTCIAGLCGDKPLGAACGAGSECASTICKQGRCCASTCDGLCESCALPGREGSCSPVPAGQDPFGHCTDQGAATCDLDGACDGRGACRTYAAGTSCAAATCSGSSVVAARVCDGQGICLAGDLTSCAPYGCGGGACRKTCSSDSHCVLPARCLGSICNVPGALRVRYAAVETAPLASSIRPLLRIENTGAFPVPLEGLELRYWYTRGSTRQQSVECTSAVMGCASVLVSVVPTPTSKGGADAYIRVVFTGSMAELAAGADSGDIVLRAWQELDALHDQSDDFSFDPSRTTLEEWSHVTLYRNGALVWGNEPG